jgi:uncharacterized membrane protein YraQ (UPF0718 family)
MTLPTILWGLAGIGTLISSLRDRKRTIQALKTSLKSFRGLLPVLMGMVALIGLILAALPPSLITKVFQMHSLAGYALVALVGTVITLPGPVAFPLAGTLLKHGAEFGLLATFITTLTMVGTVTAPAEIAHFGKRFTLVRQVVSLVLAISIGMIMAVLL